MGTTQRLPLVAGNWKMNKQSAEAVELIEDFRVQGVKGPGVEILVCPPFTALSAAREVLSGTSIKLGAQNMHWEEAGAFTGEIAPNMLVELGCQYVIIGHSERRQYFAETDETVNYKVKAALKHGLTPIICVGETLEQREKGFTDSLIEVQVKAALEGITAQEIGKVVFAYEPIWAIGTGRSADGAEAGRVCHLIRETIAGFSEDEATQVRILYGGSVKPANFSEYISQEDIDGALVGGASLKADQFAGIAKVAAQ